MGPEPASFVHSMRNRVHHRPREVLLKIFDHLPVMINFTAVDGRIVMVNQEWERTLGWTLEEIERDRIDIFAACYPDPDYRREVMEFIAKADRQWMDFKPRVRDGRIIDTTWFEVRLSDGTTIGIGMDITDRKRNEEELRASREQLRALAARVESVREAERTRIARELHDDLGQALTGLRLELSWLAGRLRRSRSETNRELVERTRSMIALVDQTVEATRRTASELRPGILDDLGLAATIEWQAADFQRRTSIRCRVSIALRTADPEPDISTAVFRTVQEALTNVARHPGASQAWIALEERDGELVVEIADDGRGITDSERVGVGSLGLLGMRERARLLGGRLTITGANGGGTTVRAAIPVATREA